MLNKKDWSVEMETLVIFYSYSGSTKVIAEEFAARNSAEIVKIEDVNRPWKLKAYTAGIFASIKGKSWPIKPLDADFSKYERLVMFAPVWAGNPPPAFNAMLEQLTQGKSVDIKMVSKSGFRA